MARHDDFDGCLRSRTAAASFIPSIRLGISVSKHDPYIGAGLQNSHRLIHVGPGFFNKVNPNNLAFGASRRQVNNCCGVNPCRRATEHTVTPRSQLSAILCAF
ncbi:hypothetical protein FHX14_000597 [Rhizobium sp. BK619]|nr:hypothetical protein [Rhizobium sp. BK619]